MRKSAAALTTGDRIIDPGSGATAVVVERRGIRSKYAPNRVGFLARMDDGRVVRFSVLDTDSVKVEER